MVYLYIASHASRSRLYHFITSLPTGNQKVVAGLSSRMVSIQYPLGCLGLAGVEILFGQTVAAFRQVEMLLTRSCQVRLLLEQTLHPIPLTE